MSIDCVGDYSTRYRSPPRPMPRLAVLAPRYPGVTLEQGLALAREQGRTIVSARMLRQAIRADGERMFGDPAFEPIQNAMVCRTGTMTAYENPIRQLDSTVEHVDPRSGIRWVFPVPTEYRGEYGAVLVSEYPDYTIEIDPASNARVVHATHVELVRQFPHSDGNYFTGVHGIPAGSEAGRSEITAILSRIQKAVGPVTIIGRGVGLLGDNSFPMGLVADLGGEQSET